MAADWPAVESGILGDLVAALSATAGADPSTARDAGLWIDNPIGMAAGEDDKQSAVWMGTQAILNPGRLLMDKAGDAARKAGKVDDAAAALLEAQRVERERASMSRLTSALRWSAAGAMVLVALVMWRR